MSAASGEPVDFGWDRVLAFDECVGSLDLVLLDPPFIFRALVASEPGHENAAAFLAHLDLQQTAMIVSSLFEVELLAVSEGLGRPELVDAWLGQLRSSTVHMVPLDGVLSGATDLVSELGMPSSVAVQVVTAWSSDVPVIVTTRAAFARVEELSLCVSNDAVDAARAIRAW